MATKNLSFQSLPSLAIAEGAVTPDPGQAGSWAWSSTLGKPVFWNGSNWSVNQVITVSGTAPSSPYLNQLWFDIS